MAKLCGAVALAALAGMAVGESEQQSEQYYDQQQLAGATSASIYTIYGACEAAGVNGMNFARQGVIRSGAPYFKAVSSEKYLYYDPDCDGGAPLPVARWVIDNDRPDVTKVSDLDNDLACNYIGSIDSPDVSRPPLQGRWTMNCNGVASPYSLTLQGGSASTPLPSTAARPLTWQGACPLKQFANGLKYDEVGVTADGRPFFKARDQELYIYFDASCDGAGANPASRWVLDSSRPSTTAARDLDMDGRCDYHARLDSNTQRPPAVGTWTMWCGANQGGWVGVEVILHDAVKTASALNSAGRGAMTTMVAFLLACAWAFGV